jgi:hypothetical protein
MGRFTFIRATDFLTQQLQAGENVRRVGIVMKASLDNLVDASKQLDDLAKSAWDRLDTAMNRQLAEFSDSNQRNAVRLTYAGSLRLPVDEQLRMLESGRHAESVTLAAAKQKPCPFEVQSFLVHECHDHKAAMLALAQDNATDLRTMVLLASHPEHQVRLSVAANIGGRMRVSEPRLMDAKEAVYNTLLRHYESEFAPHLVPVCRDENQLAQMYALTNKTASYGRLFVENPFTPDQVLVDISTSLPLRLKPGGATVASDAKQQVEKRLVTRSDVAPEPY